MKTLRAALAFILLSAAVTMTPVSAVTNPDKPVVKPATAPWVVSLWRHDDQYDRLDDGFSCTGSLINAYTIITAAHCMDGVSDEISWGFVRGQYKKSNRGEVLLPSDYTIHPNYNRFSFANDIAVVTLYFPAKSSSYLKLPTSTQTTNLLKNAPTLYGWGQLSDAASSNYLRRAVMRDMTARADLKYTTFNKAIQIGAGRTNANGTFTAACYGDSGGPLMAATKTNKYLLGVVSYGSSDGCSVKLPTVYTRVSAFASWIRAEMTEFSIDREARAINITGMKFEGTPTSSLPAIADQLEDGSWYRITTARLLTENMEFQSTDISQLAVYAYADNSQYFEIDVEVTSKVAWPIDGCGMSDQYDIYDEIPATLTMYIKGTTNWKSALKIQYTAQQGVCIGEDGIELDVESLDGSVVSESCGAAAFINPDGSHSIALERSCLDGRTNLYVRTIMSVGKGGDIEPGTDMWAGPFRVSPVVR